MTAWDRDNSYERVALTGLDIDLRIGVLDSEKQAPQRAIVDIEFYRKRGRFTGTALADCIDYNRLYTYVSEVLPSRPHTELLETVVEDIVAECLKDDRVEACLVRIGKPAIYPGAAMPSVEVYRRRGDD